MAEQYSHKKFFLQVTNKLLIEYFEHKNISFPLDLNSIYDHESDLIFDAFKKLDDVTRHEIEYDFQTINSLSTHAGVIALTEEAKEFENIHFIDTIQKIRGLHNKVMWAFLDSPKYWQAASILCHSSIISSKSWVKVNKLPSLPKPFTKLDIQLLEGSIGEYFFDKEGRGKCCKIDDYKRGNKTYFFAYPEDFSNYKIEWVNNVLKNLPHNMAFEIIFVYCEEEGSLAIYARKNSKNIPRLQQLFAEHILKANITSFTRVSENKIYDLAPIVEANFDFVIPEGSGIFSVQITQARLTSLINSTSHLDIIESPDKNKNAVHNRIDQLDTENSYISQVKLRVTFYPRPNNTSKPRNFTISMPDKCNLGYYGDDLIIREMLVASGLEPEAVNLKLSCV